MSKKGISDVITTVLIILLVLAAIVIVWQAIKGTIDTSTATLTGKTACLGAEAIVASVVKGTAATTNPVVAQVDANVTVQRKTGGSEDKAVPIILVNGVVKEISGTTACLAGASQLESVTCTIGVVLIANDKVTVGLKIGGSTCDGISPALTVA